MVDSKVHDSSSNALYYKVRIKTIAVITARMIVTRLMRSRAGSAVCETLPSLVIR